MERNEDPDAPMEVQPSCSLVYEVDAQEVDDSEFHTQEVSLESAVMKPSNTEELKGMLSQAGTDLTIQYLTGAISFEEYSKEVQRSKAAKSQKAPLQDVPPDVDPSLLPNFEVMMEQDFDGDEEESDEGEEEGFDDPGADILDSGEMDDKRDDDWKPGGKAKKTEKAKKKTTKSDGGSKQNKSGSGKTEKTPKTRKKRRKQCDLPKFMVGTNGRAMLLRAQGKTEEALQLFFEVIKHAPKASAPYEALGSIHEERGNLREAVKFYMLAANLKGRYATEWMDLVDMCRKLEDEKLVMTCFVKGLNAAYTKAELKLQILFKRSQYYLEKGNTSKWLQSREQMLPHLDKTKPSNALAFARDLVHDYLEHSDENAAICTLLFMTKEFPKEVDSEDIHSLVELYIHQKSYVKGLETVVKHCGVTLTFSSEDQDRMESSEQLQKFASGVLPLERLEFPSMMPIDLRSKLLQCLVRLKVLKNLDVLNDLIKSIVTMDSDDYGDVHYDVAETMVVSDYHKTARPILELLVRSVKYNVAAVWLTLGQCLNALGELHAAAEAYQHVVDMAPGHHEARVTLSSLLQQMGQNDVAIQILSKGGEGHEQADQELLLHKCQLLHSQGKIDQFITAALRLVSFNLPRQINSYMVRSFMSMKTLKSRKSAIPRLDVNNDPEANKDQLELILGKDMSHADKIKFLKNFYDIFVKLCRTLRDEGMSDKLAETVALGLTCPVFHMDSGVTKDLEFLCLKAGPVNDNVYQLARVTAMEDITNPQVWNLYNYILTRLKGAGIDLRFTIRCLMRNPDSMALSILNGNERLMSGTYMQALAEYMAVFKKHPNNDMTLLCSALCLLHIATNQHVGSKNKLIIQVNALLHAYLEMRGHSQETFYNLGRAWQQMNIQHAAVHYYKRALECPPMFDDGKGTFDLSHEIAYNLSRIYMRSGNIHYAKYYFEKYCTI